MRDDFYPGLVIGCAFVILCFVLFSAMEAGRCRLRAEYALSAADTVTLVKNYPACAVTVYGEGR